MGPAPASAPRARGPRWNLPRLALIYVLVALAGAELALAVSIGVLGPQTLANWFGISVAVPAWNAVTVLNLSVRAVFVIGAVGWLQKRKHFDWIAGGSACVLAAVGVVNSAMALLKHEIAVDLTAPLYAVLAISLLRGAGSSNAE